MSTNKPVGYGLIGVTAAILAVALAVSSAALSGSSGTTLEHIGYMLRGTARTAFFMLLLVYVARSIRQLTGKGIDLMRLRRYLGLSAALSHKAHAGNVDAYLRVSSERLDWLTCVFGGACTYSACTISG